MKNQNLRSVFIFGTDTNVGKTLVSSWLMAHLPYRYWKPIQSGASLDDDTTTIESLIPSAQPRCLAPFIRLQAPLSPHFAADEEALTIDPFTIPLPTDLSNGHIVEGAGGLMVPINHQVTFLDWAKNMSLPAVIVSKNHVGTINHTCLTAMVLKQYQIPIVGVILNTTPECSPDPRHASAIEEFAKVPVLASLSYFDKLSLEALASSPIPALLCERLSIP
ncbi:MAG: dethiobiotin synthase [Alphaproteobacteria bacterium]|nr:dethiobiotin synthase [Alphaproteobacteria bacterium]